ncbi:MAG TPA: YihY/virulence factor BrkB family protein [Gemmatimonadota bacterium]
MRRPRAPRAGPALARTREHGRTGLGFLRELWDKAGRDEIFFLSSGITFNVLICIVPLLLLAISILGYVVASSREAYQSTLAMVQGVLPISGEEVRNLLLSLVPERGRLGVVGLLALVWASTRLFGSLRTVLFVVFELDDAHRMSILRGKLHDAQMVVVVGLVFIVSMALTALVRWVGQLAVPLFGRPVGELPFWSFVAGVALTFAITVVMFYILYRYLPGRLVDRRTATVAAAISGILFEAAKYLFVEIVAGIADFAIYGQFSTLILLLAWVYYSAVVFILGGEIAWLLRRRRPTAGAPARRPFRRVAAGERA